MRGHIARKGARYFVVVDVRGSDGSRRRKWHSGFASRREAEAFLAKTVHELDTGRYVEPSRITVRGYLLDEWLPASAARVRPTTLASYEQSLTTLLLPVLGDVRLAELSPVMLTKLYGELLRRGSRHPAARGPLKARTVRYLHTIINRALNDAVRWRYLPGNPAAGAMPPSASAARAPEMKTWTAAQLRAFLDRTVDDQYGIAYRLAGCCGLRRGEACGLRWADVDLDGDDPVLRVRQQLVEVRYETVFAEPKTRDGRRTIALDGHTVAALRRHRLRQHEQRLLLGSAYQDGGLVIARADGSPVQPSNMVQHFHSLVVASGLPVIRYHDLRHTHATLALQAGVHPKVVTERVGHASTAFTLDTYSHVLPGLQAEAANTLGRLVFGEDALS